MARRNKIDDEIRAVSALRREPDAAEAHDKLAKALASKHAALVTAAAAVIAEADGEGLADLEESLIAAFERFMVDPVKRDRGCHAKRALVDALYRIDGRRTEPFLTGIRHVQLEPVYGGREDTADVLRGVCALALVRRNHFGVMLELSRLLADDQVRARAMAAQAIGYTGDDAAGAPLLRFKILAGDPELDVVTACLHALFALSGEGALDFVAELAATGPSELAQAAVLALGEARLPAALPALRAIAEQPVTSDLRRVAHVAIAMLRDDDAWGYLVSAVEDAPRGRALEALEALSTYRHDDTLRGRVEAAARARDEGEVSAAVAREFAAG